MATDDDKKQRELLERTERFWREAQSPVMDLLRGAMKIAEGIKAATQSPAMKAALERAQEISEQVNAALGSPGAQKLLAQAQAIAESPMMRAIAESQKLNKLTAQAAAVDKITQQHTQYEPEASVSQPIAPNNNRATERNVALKRQRVFVALVQTRVLFHDCQQVMSRKESGGSYSALAPHVVMAAFEFPTDEIDEDIGTHAEAFVRFFVSGATG